MRETIDGAALLASPVRRRLAESLESRGEMTAAELAELAALHVTTVRFHLDQLEAHGLVTSRFEKQVGPGRPRKLYAVSAAARTLRRSRAQAALETLTALLTHAFGARVGGEAITPAEVGRRWAHDNVPVDDSGAARTTGRWLAKVGAMLDVLAAWGYSPEMTTSDAGRSALVTLDHCPFLDLARANPEVVCGIHQGVLVGTMDRLGESDAVVSLEPFVTPTRCEARVSTRARFVEAS